MPTESAAQSRLEDGSRKPRSARACDLCRRKKVRCDGADMPDNRCTGCITHNVECTYETHNKRRATGDHPGSLDERLSKMESLLDQVQPRVVTAEATASSSSQSPSAPPPASEEDEIDQQGIPELTDGIRDLSILAEDRYRRHYHGKSSGFSFFVQAQALKREYTGEASDLTRWKFKREEFWTERSKRKRFEYRDPSQCTFPSPDLARDLLNKFFQQPHPCAYVFHRPSFEERYFISELHLRDDSFAALALMIFAVASKFMWRDPRTWNGDGDHRVAGENYYTQVRPYYMAVQTPILLRDFQGLALAAYFLFLSSDHHAAWTSLGVAVRFGQDVGAHRHKASRNTLDAEMWRRTFWCLMILDNNLSAALGRPVACQFEDMDLDYPSVLDESDDPDSIAFFTCWLRLSNIMNTIIRVIYSVKRPRVLLALMGDEYDQNIVAELDSSLNEWIDSIPENLRWNPHSENEVLLEQSAHLYITYYNVQLLVHRPFIPTRNKPSALSFPSLAICTNAARSCSHVLDVVRKRNMRTMPSCTFAAYASAVVLLIGTWGAKNSGVSLDYDMHVRDIDACVKYLMSQEKAYLQAGRLVDILRELASFGDLQLSVDADSPPSAKRSRDDDKSHEKAQTSPPQLSASWASSNTLVEHGVTQAKTQVQDSDSWPASTSTSSGSGGALSPSDHSPLSSIQTYGDLPFNTAALSQLSALSRLPGNPAWMGDARNTYPSGSAVRSAPEIDSSSAEPFGVAAVQSTHSPFQFLPFSAAPAPEPAPVPALAPAQQFGPIDTSESGEAGTGSAFWTSWPDSVPVPAQQPGELLEGDTLGLWSFAPTGFEWDDWGNLIDSLKVQGG